MWQMPAFQEWKGEIFMYLTSDRKGTISEEYSAQDRFLEFLYQHVAGRILLKPLVSPAVSRLLGMFLDSEASAFLIPPFIRSYSVRMSDYEPKKYKSYNDFFKRKLRPGARNIEKQADIFISPCDSRLSVYKICDNGRFFIKHTEYTVESLLRDKTLANAYRGGYLWIFRLCVDDYHHYIYVDDGRVSSSRHISGVFHTVNPVANDYFPIYKENTREYSLLFSKHFGRVLQMEVGALLVGKIENKKGRKQVTKGEEKGNFAFGGSTIILMTQEGKVLPDEDLIRNSNLEIETKVKLGECVGRSFHHDDVR
jgi:phosphatidylserine decarboxylase